MNSCRLLCQKAVVFPLVDSKLWCHGNTVTSCSTMVCAVLLIAGFHLPLHAHHLLWHLTANITCTDWKLQKVLTLLGIWLLIHTGLKLNHVSKSGLRWEYKWMRNANGTDCNVSDIQYHIKDYIIFIKVRKTWYTISSDVELGSGGIRVG